MKSYWMIFTHVVSGFCCLTGYADDDDLWQNGQNTGDLRNQLQYYSANQRAFPPGNTGGFGSEQRSNQRPQVPAAAIHSQNEQSRGVQHPGAATYYYNNQQPHVPVDAVYAESQRSSVMQHPGAAVYYYNNQQPQVPAGSNGVQHPGAAAYYYHNQHPQENSVSSPNQQAISGHNNLPQNPAGNYGSGRGSKTVKDTGMVQNGGQVLGYPYVQGQPVYPNGTFNPSQPFLGPSQSNGSFAGPNNGTCIITPFSNVPVCY